MPHRSTSSAPRSPRVQHKNGHTPPAHRSSVNGSSRPFGADSSSTAPPMPAWRKAAGRMLADLPTSRRMEMNKTEKSAAEEYLLWALAGEGFGTSSRKLGFQGNTPDIGVEIDARTKQEIIRHLTGKNFTPKFKVEGKTIFGHGTNGVWVSLAYLGRETLLTIAEQCHEQEELKLEDRAFGVFCSSKKRKKIRTAKASSEWDGIISSLRARVLS